MGSAPAAQGGGRSELPPHPAQTSRRPPAVVRGHRNPSQTQTLRNCASCLLPPTRCPLQPSSSQMARLRPSPWGAPRWSFGLHEVWAKVWSRVGAVKEKIKVGTQSRPWGSRLLLLRQATAAGTTRSHLAKTRVDSFPSPRNTHPSLPLFWVFSCYQSVYHTQLPFPDTAYVTGPPRLCSQPTPPLPHTLPRPAPALELGKLRRSTLSGSILTCPSCMCAVRSSHSKLSLRELKS